MPCPRCGALTSNAHLISPGLWRCQNRITLDDWDEDTRICGTEYNEGSVSTQLGLCWCGVAAIGLCQGACGQPLCGAHAIRPGIQAHVPYEDFLTPLSDLRAGAPGRYRKQDAFMRGWNTCSGIACVVCRTDEGWREVNKLPRISHPQDGLRHIFSVAREDRAVFEQLTGPIDLAAELQVLARASKLQRRTIVERTRKRKVRETSVAYAVGRSSHTYGGDKNTDGTPYTAVMRDSGEFSYARADGSEGPGRYVRRDGWEREWFADLERVSSRFEVLRFLESVVLAPTDS